MMKELHFLELTALAALIARREISPVEATRLQLDRIAALDGKLGSYATVTAESAMAEARAAEAEIVGGRLSRSAARHSGRGEGPVLDKGCQTAAGMRIHRDFKPTEDATVVRRLREAGAVLLGKLQMTEGAYSDHHPQIDAAPQSLERRLLAGHLLERTGRRARSRAVFRGAGLRHRRLDPLALRRKRRDRPQADMGANKPPRHVRSRAKPRPCRADGAQRRRHRRPAHGYCRGRPPIRRHCRIPCRNFAARTECAASGSASIAVGTAPTSTRSAAGSRRGRTRSARSGAGSSRSRCRTDAEHRGLGRQLRGRSGGRSQGNVSRAPGRVWAGAHVRARCRTSHVRLRL